MHDITLLQDDLRYYRSVAASDALHTLEHGDGETLPVGEVIRFGQALGLCMTRTLALAMKAQWQRSLVISISPGPDPARLTEFVRSHPEKAMALGTGNGSSAGDIPFVDELYDYFDKSGLLSGSRHVEREEFLELAGHLP